jgi:hypothetical protein
MIKCEEYPFLVTPIRTHLLGGSYFLDLFLLSAPEVLLVQHQPLFSLMTIYNLLSINPIYIYTHTHRSFSFFV